MADSRIGVCVHGVALNTWCERCPSGKRYQITVSGTTANNTQETPDAPQLADEPRAIVRAFALAMERKLAANDEGKGNWHDDGEWNHLLYAEAEMDELKQAMADFRNALAMMFQVAIFPDENDVSAMGKAIKARQRVNELKQAVLDEAADVANYLMFACDVIGALPPTDERGR